MTTQEPNSNIQRSDAFPKTTTLPENWQGDLILSLGTTIPAHGNGTAAQRPVHQVTDESLFSRRLDPFPKPNTIPNGWDLSEMF